ncbi:MAG TPA: ABC transporter permease [Cyclobacteriaceae bacterium]
MNITLLSWKNILSRPLSSLLSVVLLMLGVAIISLILLINNQLINQFEKNIKAIDMVVGAKGSPLQVILSSVFQIDTPTGNISLAEAEKLKRSRLVEWAIPLSFGDSYKGYRIVGTDSQYVNLYNAEIDRGELWEMPMEAVLGDAVDEKLQLNIGDKFKSSHGLVGAGVSHEAHDYKVVGVLKYTGSVVDQLILTSNESFWEVHKKEPDEANEHEDEEKEITAMLVNFRSPMGMVTLPRKINEGTNMQAALPAFEINKLISLLGIGVDTLNLIGLVIIIVSGVSVFISLYASFLERRYEMALMRTYGASGLQLFWIMIQEGLFLSFIGFIAGMALSRLGIVILSNAAEERFHYQFTGLKFLESELLLFGGTILIGILASLIPAVQVYKVNIAKTLEDN